MASITPCRTLISDRFPVASFVIRVPGTKCFEVACTTDPLLLQREHMHRRDSRNFFTTRLGGLLRAPAGEATVLVPPDQLLAFAGSTRVYYALGAYDSPRGEGARFSVDPSASDRVPYVQLAPDFTGRALERSRLGGKTASKARWGRGREQLVWGGDLLGAPKGRDDDYDDGFDPGLWEHPAGPRATAMADPPRVGGPQPPPYVPPPTSSSQAHVPSTSGAADEYGAPAPSQATYGAPSQAAEPQGYEHPSDLPQAYGSLESHPVASHTRTLGAPGEEPPGFEDAAALGAALNAATYGRTGSPASPQHNQQDAQHWGAPTAEPDGFEDGASLRSHGAAYGSPTSQSQAPRYHAAPRGYAAQNPQGHGAAGDEPPGFEDPTEIRQHYGAQQAPQLATGSSYGSPAHPESYASAQPAYGRRSLGSAPPSPPATSPGEPTGIPLDTPDKARVVRSVFKRRGGVEGYAAVLADADNGVSWGLFGFNQRTGTLGRVIAAAWRRDQDWYGDSSLFDFVFGVERAPLLQQFATRDTAESRMAPVAGKPLWDPEWTRLFAAAGRLHLPAPEGMEIEPARDPFKLAQNEVAVTSHLDDVLQAAQRLGFNTDRGLAMLLDRSVDLGTAAAEQWFSTSLSSAPTGGGLKARLAYAASLAPAEPWGDRLRSLAADSTDLFDTIFRLDE